MKSCHWITEYLKQADNDPPSSKGEPETPKDPLPSYDELLESVTRLQTELSQRIMTDKLTGIARELKIPEAVISTDLAMFADRFVLHDGNPVLANGFFLYYKPHTAILRACYLCRYFVSKKL